jgi:ankyrin repeat protein
MAAAEMANAVDLLVSKGARVNTADNEGRTPLMHAMNNLGTNTAAFLLENGANINAKDKEGQSALILAITLARYNPVRIYGQDEKKKAAQSKESYLDLVGMLLEHGADVNVKTKSGLTPLSLAVSRHEPEVAELLRRHGAK